MVQPPTIVAVIVTIGPEFLDTYLCNNSVVANQLKELHVQHRYTRRVACLLASRPIVAFLFLNQLLSLLLSLFVAVCTPNDK